MIRATLRELRAIGVRRIVVIGRFPTWRTPPKRVLAQAYRELRGRADHPEHRIPMRDGSSHLEFNARGRQ